MTTLLQLQASLFGDEGQSSRLVQQFTARWEARHPEGRVIHRDLAATPVPHLDLERFQAFITDPAQRHSEQQTLVEESDVLIDELVRADTIVMGVPMYNFSVPSTLRAYFDYIARAGITFRYTAEGPEGLLKGKRAWVFIARGGIYGETHSQTAYLRQFLEFVGITDTRFIHAEGLAMGDDTKQQGLTAAKQRMDELLVAA